MRLRSFFLFYLLVSTIATSICLPAQKAKKPMLFGVKIDSAAKKKTCRSVPFFAAQPGKRGETKRLITPQSETIPIGSKADTIYILGMINHGWDCGVAHWGYHPELMEKRTDQLHIGKSVGDIEIRYKDGSSDSIPLIKGTTIWHFHGWNSFKEPFASRNDYMKVFRDALKLHEDDDFNKSYSLYYLAVKPREKVIESIIIHNNTNLRGRPLVSAVTLANAKPADNLIILNSENVNESDLKPKIDVTKPMDWSAQLDALTKVLYTSDADLPKKVDLLKFPPDLDVTKIRFLSGPQADMLTNIWTANLMSQAEKFDSQTGIFIETKKDSPCYGSYDGIGTWAPIGVYYGNLQAYSRCAEHFAAIVIRNVNNAERLKNFIDFVDKYLYYYRSNHDLNKGPANDELDISRYPKDAPPHWGYMIAYPSSAAGAAAGKPGIGFEINELPGTEAMDGHASVIIARWLAWRVLGASVEAWTKPRSNVYGKSNWDSTRDSADFICWFMDYTGMDVMFSEEETTGWAGGPPSRGVLVPKNMNLETDPKKIKKNYANSNMYQTYATWACNVALRCSAQIADKIGKDEIAKKYRRYAARLHEGMNRLLKVGDHTNFTWRVSSHSVFPSLQESLAHAWLSIYIDGLDNKKWDKHFTEVTRNSLRRQLNRPYGHAPALAMGYGQGWLTMTALLLDEMDDAGPLLVNIAKYAYDKNMNYVDKKRGIDWQRWMWLIPEGTNILPNGSWHRIGDLSNSANQGPPIHALETCAGIDDTDPYNLKIIPRVPKPLTGINVSNFFTLVPKDNGLTRARINYTYTTSKSFSLASDIALPTLSVRFGPFAGQNAAQMALKNTSFPTGSKQRIETSGHFKKQNAWWLWVEGFKNVKNVEISFQY